MQHRNFYNLSVTALLLVFYSCVNKSKPIYNNELSELKKTGMMIQHDFKMIMEETKNLASYTQHLYLNQNFYANRTDTSKYKTNTDGVFYKPVNDNGSSVYVSGHYPLSINIKKIIYFTEPLDSVFRKIIKSFSPLVSQVYYYEKHSCYRMYPYIDVLTQFFPKQDVNSYNEFYLADKKHNPEKKVVMISNPYVDPAGRGWVITSVAPVYYYNNFEGAVGVDVAIDAMKKKYLSGNTENIILTDSAGIIIFIDDKLEGLLEIPPLKTHKYIETIKGDEYLSNEFNLMYSKNKNIRTAFTELIRNKKDNVTVDIDNEKYYLLSYKISDLNWYLIKTIKEK